jgi:sRNA-binding regulator protein Hfq
MVNRKLVRPNLAEIKEKFSSPRAAHATAVQNAPSRESHASGPGHRRRPAPPEQTNAEAFYYLKQMNGKTPMVLVLDNEERLRGHIEWYDRQCLKVHRDDGPNVLVFKHSIRYLYKEEEETDAD